MNDGTRSRPPLLATFFSDTTARIRDNGLRSDTASASVSEADDLVRAVPGSGEKDQEEGKTEESVKLRNIDTGEDIELAEIGDRVPPSLDPGELFRSKDL